MSSTDRSSSEELRLSPEVVRVLRKAGWREGRSMAAEVDKWQRALRPEFTLFAAAREALLKFGGIRVEQDGPGEECARETFDLNPLHALGEADRFQSFESITPAKLCPLGEAGGGHAFLAISERGAIYALMEELWLVGDSIEEALEALVLGRRSRKAT